MTMPFRPDPFLNKVERLRWLRHKPVLGYVIAVASVALASAVREGFSDLLVGVRFAPYYLAVGLTAVAGGGGPGLLALALSVAAAAYLMEPIAGSSTTPTAAVGTMLFLVIAGFMLTVICLLNHAIDSVWHQAANTKRVIDSQIAGVIGVDSDGKIELVNSAAEQQLGYTQEELLGTAVELLVPIEVRGGHAKLRPAYMSDPQARRLSVGRELFALTRDGSMLPVEIGLSPVSNGGRLGTLATIVDISERKKQEHRAEVLVNEVRHRARNLLTLIQALALRTLPDESAKTFVGTLQALARTQEIFGTNMVAPLRKILDGEPSGLSAQSRISGCDILLKSDAAQDFSLIVHELTTNALKYGALSRPNGTIVVSGRKLANGMFHFGWTERGGPPISAQPQRTGFGETILREMPRRLHAITTLDYPPEGLRYRLVAPIEHISNIATLASASATG
jgi:PAS domain S-box-containing protein